MMLKIHSGYLISTQFPSLILAWFLRIPLLTDSHASDFKVLSITVLQFLFLSRHEKQKCIVGTVFFRDNHLHIDFNACIGGSRNEEECRKHAGDLSQIIWRPFFHTFLPLIISFRCTTPLSALCTLSPYRLSLIFHSFELVGLNAIHYNLYGSLPTMKTACPSYGSSLVSIE